MEKLKFAYPYLLTLSLITIILLVYKKPKDVTDYKEALSILEKEIKNIDKKINTIDSLIIFDQNKRDSIKIVKHTIETKYEKTYSSIPSLNVLQLDSLIRSKW